MHRMFLCYLIDGLLFEYLVSILAIMCFGGLVLTEGIVCRLDDGRLLFDLCLIDVRRCFVIAYFFFASVMIFGQCFVYACVLNVGKR
jgi:hypothetical protein